MKRILLSIGILTGLTTSAQMVIDTVTIGAGYANQCWYSLENDEQVNVPKNDWDIAFETTGFGSSIGINPAIGTKIWAYPGDTGQFATLDTAGMSSWTQLHNSDTSWAYGALSQNQSGLDLGWGTYSTITHQVVGDELFVIELSNGVYQKLWIQSLASSVYTFRHATLDNSMDMTHTLAKSNFTNKNFGYFSLQNHQEVDKEPANTDWDVMFGQYEASQVGWYLVSGVLANAGTQVAKAHPVNDSSTYVDYHLHTFDTKINGIGYDWKSFNFTVGWVLEDSLVYFVETQEGDIWKMVFTGFSGSSAGQFIFGKEKLASNSVAENQNMILNTYPNPATEQLNLTYNSHSPVTIELVDMNGRTVKVWQGYEGLQTKTVQISDLPAGMYTLMLQSDKGVNSERIVIR